MKLPKDRDNDQGSTLVSVLVALALLSIVGGLYYSGTVRSMKAHKAVESKERYNSVESALVNEIASVLREMDKTSCLNVSKITSRPFGFESGSATLEFTSAVKLANATSPALNAVQKRCSQPVFISGADIGNPARSHLYFCLQFTPSTAGSFAEIAIDFESTSSGGKTSCQTYLEDRSTIARITYGIYFSDNESNKKYGLAIAKSEVSP